MNATLETPPTRTDKPAFWKLPRREFFLGGLAGLVAGKATEYVQPLEWTQKTLPKGTRFSFSQFGEDLIVTGLFTVLGVEKPSYLDIGAWEPIQNSNTYAFYRKGGRGVLVEPNPARTKNIRRERPEDVTLEAGIGLDDTATLDYYMLSDDQLNTFDKDQVEHLKKNLGVNVERVVKMPLVGINRVMEEHFGGSAPDFLSIDVEGLDLAILKTMNFDRYRPKIICAETVITRTLHHNTGTPEFLATKGYVVRGGTLANMIFVDSKLIPPNPSSTS